MNIYPENINITLDSSVKHITRVACMALSGVIENGIVFANNQCPHIVIYKDRIDFGICKNPELEYVSGNLFLGYNKEFNNIVYYYRNNYRCSLFGTLDYAGALPPTTPDNTALFQMIYPRFA